MPPSCKPGVGLLANLVSICLHLLVRIGILAAFDRNCSGIPGTMRTLLDASGIMFELDHTDTRLGEDDHISVGMVQIGHNAVGCRLMMEGNPHALDQLDRSKSLMTVIRRPGPSGRISTDIGKYWHRIPT